MAFACAEACFGLGLDVPTAPCPFPSVTWFRGHEPTGQGAPQVQDFTPADLASQFVK